MCPGHATKDNLIRNVSGRTYSYKEAFDLLEVMDTMPTGNLHMRWFDSKTGGEVILGRCGGNSKNNNKFVPGRKKKKEKIINPFVQVSKKEQFKALSRIHSKK